MWFLRLRIQPPQKILLIAMRRKGFRRPDFSLPGKEFTVRAYERAFALFKISSRCPGGLVSREEEDGLLVVVPVVEVAMDATACEHAAGTNDDEWPFFFPETL